MILSPALVRSLQRPLADSARALALSGRHEVLAMKRLQALALTGPQCQRLRFSSTIKAKAAEVGTVTSKENSQLRPVKPAARKPRGASKAPRWTPELDNQILDLRTAQRTWEYISLATGRSPSAVSDRYYTALDPALQTWTPAMFSRLDQMVESGEKWGDIGSALDANVITCQHQWRTLGKGRYRVKGVVAASQSISWTSQEIETFWKSWLKYGVMDWKAIATDLRSKSVAEVREAFRALTVGALQDAPGWAKLEAYSYVTDTSKAARARKQREAEEMLEISGGAQLAWTPADHEALLVAVEKHGLFSGWDTIREMVKPELSEDEIEAEYYRLNGVSMKTATRSEGSSNDKSKVVKARLQDAVWTGEEINTLNTILMKYSTLPIWTEQAAKHGVEPANDDYETLFKKSDLPKPAADTDDDSESSRPPSSKAKKHKTKSSKLALSEDAKTDSPWNDDRVKRLKRLVSQQQQQERASGHHVNWSWIAEHIGPGFNASMCITMWQSLPDHSIPQIEGPRFWDESDMELLLQGISTHGKQWILIQKNFLSDRTTDSIRRKVSNVQRKRDLLVEEARQKAEELKATNPDMDVNTYMEENVRNDENYTGAVQLEAMFDEYKKNKGGKARGRPKTKKSA